MSFLWLWPTQSEVIRDIWKKSAQINQTLKHGLFWVGPSKIFPGPFIHHQTDTGRSFSTPGNEPFSLAKFGITKRQLLVKLRGPRRLAKSVVLQPPEGLNMQQFRMAYFLMIGQNEWNLETLPSRCPSLRGFIMIYPRGKQRTGPVGGFCTSFCLAGVQYQRDHFRQNLGKYLQHLLQDHSTRG